MDVKLIAVSPKGGRKVVTLKDDVTVLGRQDNCQLRVPLKEISRQHCQFIRKGKMLSIKDLGSSNGTYVNGEKVILQSLKAGDVVSVADAVRVMVQIDGMPENIDEQKLAAPAKVAAAAVAAPVGKPAVAKAPVKSAAPAAKKPVAKPAAKPGKSVDDEIDFDSMSSTATRAGGRAGGDDDELVLSESFFMDDDDDDDDHK